MHFEENSPKELWCSDNNINSLLQHQHTCLESLGKQFLGRLASKSVRVRNIVVVHMPGHSDSQQFCTGSRTAVWSHSNTISRTDGIQLNQLNKPVNLLHNKYLCTAWPPSIVNCPGQHFFSRSREGCQPWSLVKSNIFLVYLSQLNIFSVR